MTSILIGNHTSPSTEHICKEILYFNVPSTKIRLWDVIILLPNLIFLLYLIVRFKKARLKLRATNSPIFFTFYVLVFINVVVSVLRCTFSFAINATYDIGEYIDIVLWVIVRFFLLSTEISVVVFGLAFGHLDSRSSIKHVLVVTSLISLSYSITQFMLEILAHDEVFNVPSHGILLFGHGGVIFWFASSMVFTLLYLLILVLPCTKLRNSLPLPAKRSFYVYITILMALNFSCSIGGGLMLSNIKEGLCVVDVTTCVYFMFFTPLVYNTFLIDFFGVAQPSILFSYKSQPDDPLEDDTVSLPHQNSFSSARTDSDYIYQGSYSTRMIPSPSGLASNNPLFIASLQSPDSITGYSLDDQEIVNIPQDTSQ